MLTAKDLIKRVRNEKTLWQEQDEYEDYQKALIRITGHYSECEYCRNSFDASEWNNYLEFENFVKITPYMYIHTCKDDMKYV